MSKVFNQITFAEIATFRNGLNFDKDSKGKGCLFIGVPSFKNHFTPEYQTLGEVNPTDIASEEDFLEKNDIIFVRSNGNKKLVGRSLFINKNIKALYSGFCIRARIHSPKIHPEYVAYYTRTKRFKKSISSSSGTNINNLNQGILGNVKIPLIPLEKQKAISNVLSKIDKKIDLNNKINAELESIAKLIYDYWFVQFDFPDSNGRPYKNSGGKMVWNEELKREIPEGWEVHRLSKYLNIGSGHPFDSNSYIKNGKFKVITIKNVQDYGLDTLKTDTIYEVPT